MMKPVARMLVLAAGAAVALFVTDLRAADWKKSVTLSCSSDLAPFNTAWSPWIDGEAFVFATGKTAETGGDVRLQVAAAKEGGAVRFRLEGWSVLDLGASVPAKLQLPAGFGSAAWTNAETMVQGHCYLLRKDAAGPMVVVQIEKADFSSRAENGGFNPAFRRFFVEGKLSFRYIGPAATTAELMVAPAAAPKADAAPAVRRVRVHLVPQPAGAPDTK